jgi:hypothetical protein
VQFLERLRLGRHRGAHQSHGELHGQLRTRRERVSSTLVAHLRSEYRSVPTDAPCDYISADALNTLLLPAAVGSYTYVNVDEGWLVGRKKTAPYAMVEDKKAFPSTMAGLGEWIHSLDVPGKGKIMQYGLYTCRGVQQCDTGEYIKRCEAAQASGLMPSQTKGRCEGSHGFEKQVRS